MIVLVVFMMWYFAGVQVAYAKFYYCQDEDLCKIYRIIERAQGESEHKQRSEDAFAFCWLSWLVK